MESTMNEVNLEYTVIMGRGCASPWMPWSVDLTDEEMAIYKRAIENEILLEEVEELSNALYRAEEAISEYEKECAEDYDDEFDADNWSIRVKFVDPNEGV